MFCRECGSEIKEGSRFCVACGNPVAVPQAEVKQNDYIPDYSESVQTEVKQTAAADYIPAYSEPVQNTVNSAYYTSPQLNNKPSGSAVMPAFALVMGLLSLFSWIVPLAGVVTSLLAIIFGGVGIRMRLKGMAIAGLVMGILLFLWAVLVVIAFCVVASQFGTWDVLWKGVFHDFFMDIINLM